MGPFFLSFWSFCTGTKRSAWDGGMRGNGNGSLMYWFHRHSLPGRRPKHGVSFSPFEIFDGKRKTFDDLYYVFILRGRSLPVWSHFGIVCVLNLIRGFGLRIKFNTFRIKFNTAGG